jgi:four helix bundle protein
MAVYRLAREHSRAVCSLIHRAKVRGYADLVSQLRRSAASIPANILEATGEWRQRKRLHYLMIAKGSTWECWAHSDSMVDFDLARAEDVAEVRDLQRQITALLITTIRNLEAGTPANSAARATTAAGPRASAE